MTIDDVRHLTSPLLPTVQLQLTIDGPLRRNTSPVAIGVRLEMAIDERVDERAVQRVRADPVALFMLMSMLMSISAVSFLPRIHWSRNGGDRGRRLSDGAEEIEGRREGGTAHMEERRQSGWGGRGLTRTNAVPLCVY